MRKGILNSIYFIGLMGLMGCASSNDRQPASYNRAGRPYEEPRAMNHRSTDTNSLYQACLRERPEVSCRNRLGR